VGFSGFLAIKIKKTINKMSSGLVSFFPGNRQGSPGAVKAWTDVIPVGNNALVAGDCHGSSSAVFSKSGLMRFWK
jgi:hypothetical protein